MASQQEPLPYHPSSQPSMTGALHPGVEAQMTGPAGYEGQFQDRPPAHSYSQSQSQAQQQRPGGLQTRPQGTMAPVISTAHDIRTVRTSSQFALREYLSLTRKRQTAPYGSTMSLELEDRIRVQSGLLLGDLKTLREEVGAVIRACEGRRWKRWIFGGALASFIPGVKAIMRRVYPRTENDYRPANSTEHAFQKSKSLMARINESVLGRGGVAQVAMFVVSLLWVFQNEVSLQVAKTVHKRLRKLCGKVEKGGVEVSEGDMNLLEGWRWRVLLWGQ